ncbi:MAG: hypothetical protein ABI894_13725 [Ilumatobacteraceae bacterium]
MERRLAITYIVSATATFGIGCVAIAVTAGGLFASAAPNPGGGKQVEIVDDYVVVHSPTTAVVVDTSAAVVEAAERATLARAATAAPSIAATAPATVVAPEVTEATEATEVAPAPGPAARSAQAPAPAPAPPHQAEPEPQDDHPATTTAPSSPATRPPVPGGCKDPEWEHGRWHCDDD